MVDPLVKEKLECGRRYWRHYALREILRVETANIEAWCAAYSAAQRRIGARRGRVHLWPEGGDG
jgi:hypothetical protein